MSISVPLDLVNKLICDFINESVKNMKLISLCDRLCQKFQSCTKQPDDIQLKLEPCERVANICRLLLRNYTEFTEYPIPKSDNTWINKSLEDLGYILEKNSYVIKISESKFNRKSAMNFIVLYAKMRFNFNTDSASSTPCQETLCDQNAEDLSSNLSTLCRSLHSETMYDQNAEGLSSNPSTLCRSLHPETMDSQEVPDILSGLPLIEDDNISSENNLLFETSIQHSDDNTASLSSIPLLPMNIESFDERTSISEPAHDNSSMGQQTSTNTETEGTEVLTTQQTKYDIYLNRNWVCSYSGCSHRNDGGFKCFKCHQNDSKRLKESEAIRNKLEISCKNCGEILGDNLHCEKCNEWICRNCTMANKGEFAFCVICLEMASYIDNIEVL